MKPKFLISTLLAGALAVAGCGGASDDNESSASSGGGGGGGGAKTSLSLVAYSTPRGRLRRDHPGLPEDRRGQGRRVQDAPTAPRATRAAPSRPARRPTSSRSRIEPDMTRLVDAGLVADDWQDTSPTKGLVTTSLVSFVVRKGNPKNIKTWDDLLKPGVEVLTPNPFTSGAAKWNLLGAYGSPRRASTTSTKLLTEHVDGPGQVRPRGAADVHSAARATSCSPTSTRRRPRRRRARGRRATSSPTTRSRSRSRSPRPRPRRRRPRSSSTTSLGASAPAALRRLGLPPGQRGGPREEQGQVPRPGQAQDDRRPRRLVEGQRRALRPRERLDRQDRGRRGGVDRQVSAIVGTRHRRRRRRRRAGLAGAGALGLGVAHAVAQPDRAAAAGGAVVAVARRRPGRRSGTPCRAARPSPRCASR